jgi:para-nitrobenzyl esterase
MCQDAIVPVPLRTFILRKPTMQKFALFAAVALLGVSDMAMAQVVRTASGPVRGLAEHGVLAFKGIPYAAAPTGANRWRAPQPVKPWAKVRAATSYGADCAQAPFPPDAAPIVTKPAEDCLFLNVWKPAAAKPGAKLPVMVWIHGGGFVNGGSSPAVYSGHNFARDGVVLVSINYRLGRFGFFAHPGLAAEGGGGNFGFLDQIAALKWVRANAAQFGGDPAKVTVFGESAGGMSVHMLLQSPLARGLFAKAIIQSGGGRDRTLPMPDMAKAASIGNVLAPGASAAQLRALPEDAVTGGLSMMTMNQPSYSGPMVDGRTILGPSVNLIAAGKYARVPVMVGANSADGFPFMTDKDKIFAEFGPDEAEARKLYDPDGQGDGLLLATMTSADRMFIEPARAVARGLAGKGQQVWLFRFAHNGVKMGAAMGGAPHASEIPYVFDLPGARPDQLDTGQDAAVAQRTHGYWVNFAKYGRPEGRARSLKWPTATAADTKVFVIGTNGDGHVEDPRRATVDFAERRVTR